MSLVIANQISRHLDTNLEAKNGGRNMNEVVGISIRGNGDQSTTESRTDGGLLETMEMGIKQTQE